MAEFIRCRRQKDPTVWIAANIDAGGVSGVERGRILEGHSHAGGRPSIRMTLE